MTHRRTSALVRIAAATVGLALAATACGTETVETVAAPAGDVPLVATAPPATTGTTVAPTAAPSADDDRSSRPTQPTEARSTTVPPTVADTTPPPTTDPPPTTVPAAPPAPCGDFAELPPRPDSMPTLTFDTDGDGPDDAVTAYGAGDGWRVRVVQDDVVSEAVVPEIVGWAYLSDPVPTADGDHIVLVDNDTSDTWTFATDEAGCIGLVTSSPSADIDDLTIGDDLLCGPLAALPSDALIGSDDWFDLDGEGVANDRIVAYSDGTWKLRAEFSFGAESEIEIPGAGVHGVRLIGFADVDATYGGDEFLAVVGGGASALEIGIFSFLEGGCIFRYAADGGGDFSLWSGASIGHGEGAICGDGYVTMWGYQLEQDDTYTLWDASFEPVAFGTFGYMPSSDGFVEGLALADVSTDLFDCNGLAL